MAALVEEIMSHELFSVRPEEPAEPVLRYLHLLGVASAPVLDERGHPVGLIALGDFLGPRAGNLVGERMTTPALTIHARATIEDAGRLMAESGNLDLVAVDERGAAVGMVAALDVLRGLLGLPLAHEPTSPHYDPRLGLAWTDDYKLCFDRVEAAPAEPGIVMLLHGARGIPERILWVEAASNLRARLVAMLSRPEDVEPPELRAFLHHTELRFRCATIGDAAEREHAMQAIARDLIGGNGTRRRAA